MNFFFFFKSEISNVIIFFHYYLNQENKLEGEWSDISSYFRKLYNRFRFLIYETLYYEFNIKIFT